MEVKITAEKDGETYSAVAGPHHESPYLKNQYSFDGTTNSNDGTMIFMLSNVVPEITSDTINDYKWSITFTDTKADSTVLTVKNAEIVDKSTSRVSKPQEAFNFKLDGTSKTLTFQSMETVHKVLYYKGFDTPYISYTDENGNKISEALTKDSTKANYTHKYVFENGIAKDRTIITREYPCEWKKGDEPYYPINDIRNLELYKRYRALATGQKNVIFGGRLGMYKYFDMDDTIEAALELSKEVLV
jgi:hypothetical protein